MEENPAKTGLFLQSFPDIAVGTGLMQHCIHLNFIALHLINHFIGKAFKKNASKIPAIDF
ncbi:MAG: hypothetical protein H7Y01_15860 [Ferruginibacter sp.]|nr:hypothetical protein [Chitinophagaceae bacterium]